MKYRSEIDGLRALAVVPVILFHAGFNAFSGGFVGVDVFFVISGYLITTILLNDLEAGKFSIVHFYERRARRILPALFLVMFACLPFAWFWLLPQDMKSFSQSLVAVSVFASNILFWRTSGYFDTATELKPLIHTWSLSVEEQYYVLFPLFLYFAWRLGKRWTVGILAVVALVSLGLAQWGAYAKPAFTFYMLPTRAWELLIGAFVAFYYSEHNIKKHKYWASELGSLLGFALIAYATFAFSEKTPFPSLYALVPTVGAALIIVFATNKTLIGKLLSTKPFLWVGLISYSAYLWHQPLFAFARHRSFEEPSHLLMAVLAVVTLPLAYLTWRLVERPFRNKNRFSSKRILLMAVVFNALFISLGSVVYNFPLSNLKYPPNIKWSSLGERLDTEGDICEPIPNLEYAGLSTCSFGDVNSNRTLVLYGDSHSQAISRALNDRMKKIHVKVIKAIFNCGVIFEITSNKSDKSRLSEIYSECNKSFENLKRLIRDEHASTLLVSRWTFQYFPMPGLVEELPFKNGVGGIERDLSYRENFAIFADGSKSDLAEPKKQATLKLINGLAEASAELYINYPIPEIGWNIFSLNDHYYRENQLVLDNLHFPKSTYDKRNLFIVKLFEEYQELPKNIIYIRADKVFCEDIIKDNCVAQINGVPLYYDDDHLSDAGAYLFVEDFVKKYK